MHIYHTDKRLNISLIIPFIYSLVLLFSSVAHAQNMTILVDFGQAAYKTINPDAKGNYWNNVSDDLPRLNLSNLVLTNGRKTPVSIDVAGFSGGANANGTTNPDTALLRSLAIASATRDSFYVSGNSVMRVTLSQLPKNSKYKITLFGSRDAVETRTTRYDVLGARASTQFLVSSGSKIGILPEVNANRSSSCVFDQFECSSSGEITIEVRRSGLSFGYLGSLMLEMLDPINLPPVASSCIVAGAPRVGTNLRTFFKYEDVEGDPMATVEYQFEKATNDLGSGLSVVQNWSNNSGYILSNTDLNCFYRCGIRVNPTSGSASNFIFYTPWYGSVRDSHFSSIYFIGNSFTRWANIPKQTETLSMVESGPSVVGSQLTDGQNLGYHWDSGIESDFFLTSGTRSRREISTRSWEVVVIQPHSQEWMSSSYSQFHYYSRLFAVLAVENQSQVYLNAYWPWATSDISQQTQINNSFEQVRSTLSVGLAKPVLIIPSGEALRAVISFCGKDELVGYNRSSFYIDERHQSPLGGYVTALTHYATIYRKSPVGLTSNTLSAKGENQIVTLPNSVAARIQQIVWDVVQRYPNALTASLAAVNTNPLPLPTPVFVDPPFVVESLTPSDPILLAYAFAQGHQGLPAPIMNPAELQTARSSDRFAVAYYINPAAHADGVIYKPQWSYDLRRWTETQPENTMIDISSNKVTVSWQSTSRWRYMRVHVSKP